MRMISRIWLRSTFIALILATAQVQCNPDAKRLYDDLLSNYNRLIRPVNNVTTKLTVKLGLKLSQLIDVDLKNQVMTTNVWVEQAWHDYKLKWNPEDYGGVDTLYVPSQHIWLPDIVLFNNADGKYEVTLMTKASLKYTGEVVWKPPAIYKSSCKINVEWFPFDEQNCDMKFGSWTYDGHQLDLKHMSQERGSNVVKVGIDLKEFYLSVEWDILDVPATRNEEYYVPQRAEDEDDELDDHEDEDPEAHKGMLLTDITFYMTLRRKTLFYTVNLIIPCVGISFLTVLVFYLPSDSGEKVTLCISILLSLTVFFLLLAEIIPPTSLAVPLLGKYLLFTMILVTLSICVTVGVLNVHFRSPSTHRMSPWVRKVFIVLMPKILFMQRPHYIPRYSAEPPEKLANKLQQQQHQRMICDETLTSCNSTLRSKPNGHVSSDKHWDVDMDEMSSSFKDPDCTSHCHHHPHLTTPDPDCTSHCHHHPHLTSNGHATLSRQQCNSSSHAMPKSVSPQHQEGTPQPPLSQVARALKGVEFIAQHIKKADKDIEEIEDWKFCAMVLDRLFLWLFTAACLGGTAGIILRAPSLYDMREPIDMKLSEIFKV